MSLEEITVERFDDYVRVEISHWQRAAQICKEQLHHEYFTYLSAIDWLPNPNLDGEQVFVVDKKPTEPQEIITDPLIRKGGGSSRFQLIAHVYDVDAHHGLTLVSDLDDVTPTAPSWTPVYKGADWHERETWEMFGVQFTGHPNLRHIYLPEEFEGHPLRKDFPLLARVVRPWPGLVDMEEIPTQKMEEMPTPEEKPDEEAQA